MRLGARLAGRFRLVKGPMRGGTGEVWVAEDAELGREVVLKRALLGDDSPTAFDRLQAEARALARFSHPHVVTLYDAVRVRTRTRVTSWLVLEYVPGGSLDRWPAIPPESAARIGAQIADALAALHAAGIVHCDVKPGNIVVTETGTAKLADFGAAYRIDAGKTITPNGAISHTPAYAAPEVIRGRPEPASDVFSLGVTIAALITGRPVRSVPDPAGSGDAATRPEVGPLRDVLTAMLRPVPADRPDAAEARRSLEAAAGEAKPPLPHHLVSTENGEGPTPLESDSGEHTRGRAKPWRSLAAFARRRPGVVAAGAAVIVLAVAFSLVPVILHGGGDADANGRRKNPSSLSLVGDPHEADPCGLTDPAPLARFGRTEVDDAYGNFDRCDVIVHGRGGSVVDVQVDLNSDPEPEDPGPVRTVGRIRVVADRPETDECNRTLLLPAPDRDTNVTVTANHDEGGPAPLCAMADAATATAVAALNRGQIPRRSPRLPQRSLAQRNACTLLDADALNGIPGVDAGDPDVGFGGWDCTWHSTTRDIQAKLRFDRDAPLTASEGRITRFRGYRGAVQPQGDGDGTCVVRVAYRVYTDRTGERTAELLYLVVRGAPSTRRLCSMATRLADAAAESL